MDDFDDYHAKALARFPNFHHSSPLTYYPQRHIVQLYAGDSTVKSIPFFTKILEGVNKINKRKNVPVLVSDDPAQFYHRVLESSTTSNFDSRLSTNSKDFKSLLTLALSDVKVDLSTISKSHPGISDLHENFVFKDEEIQELSRSMSQVLSMRSYLMKIRNVVQNAHVSVDESLKGPFFLNDIAIYTVKEIVMVEIANSNVLTLLNYDQLLMLTDTVSCRMMTRIAVHLNQMRKFDNLPTWEVIRWVYSWGDEIIQKYGMNAYAVLGEFESIITGLFVSFPGTDPLKLGDDFLESITETAYEIQRDYNIPAHHVLDLVKFLKNIQSVNCLSEIFGLRKHWGNPMVDAEASGRAIQEKLEEDIPLNGIKLHTLKASFHRMITMEFIRQHGEWPKCEFLDIGRDYPLKTAWSKGTTRIPENTDGHEHLHWGLQRFFCNCVMSDFLDQLDLLSDKSVSVYREHADAIYVQSLCKPHLKVSFEENRRLILEFLRKEHMPIKDIFRIVMCGAIPQRWLLNSASMKGTEMKHEKARVFAVLTYELRQYFAATEELIKDHIFRYNPHQTMTMSESELLKKLREITKQMDPDSESRFLCVMHIIDFSKWNLRMKYENTCGVFKSIDDFLGTPNLIESSHRIFSHMINVIQDAFNPPENGVHATESDVIWRGHTAGWEGQRQKGWTVLTSALLADLERMTGIHSTICGQGDNQTLLSYFPIPAEYKNPGDWIKRSKENVKKILDEFYSNLEYECLQVGLKVKTAESCRSLCYFNYGKRLYFSGIELSMTLKRISKTITEPNGTYPMTELLLKTEEGAAFSAGLYSHPSIWPYVISRLSLLMTLNDSFTNNPLTGKDGQDYAHKNQLSINNRFLSRLIKIPASLGGPPQLTLASYLYRGHPDPLCADLVLLTLRAKQGDESSSRIIKLAKSGRWFSTNFRDKSSLIGSPYSLNLNIPQSAREPLERKVSEALENSCKNPDVKALFSTQVKNHDLEVITVLSSMEPFQPLVANDIYGRTLPGRRKTFISGLTNTTSLGRILFESHEAPLINEVIHRERKQLEHWVNMVRDVSTFTLTAQDKSNFDDHHVLAQYLREKSWKAEIVGVTVPHPLEQFILLQARHDICDEHKEMCCAEHLVFVRHSEELIHAPGIDANIFSMDRSRSGDPYIGSTVSEGLIQRYLTCQNPTTPWKDSIRLNILRRWVGEEGSSLDKFIKLLIRCRTDCPLDILDLASGRPSRLSYSHRAALMGAVKSCAVSSTSNMFSRIYVSSNRMGDYSHGEYNYHLAYGPAFLCMQSLICLDAVFDFGLKWSESPRQIYHAHVRNNNVPQVYDGNVDVINCNFMREPFAVNSMPPLLFTPYITLNFTNFLNTAELVVWTPFDRATVTEAKISYANQLLGDSFAEEITIREQVTSEMRSSYTHRENPISVGDVTIVGIHNLANALAVNFLLMAPYSTFMPVCDDPTVFSVYTRQYLDTYSYSFWDQFNLPLSNQKHIAELTRLCSKSSHYLLTRSSRGAIELLKQLVINVMRIKRNGIVDYFSGLSSQFPFQLFAPSLYALRLLWSKTVELSIISLMHFNLIAEGEIIAYARDFAANIHSTNLSDFQSTIITVISDFSELCEKLDIYDVKSMPFLKSFSLIHPWVDKARVMSTAPSTVSNSTKSTIPAFYPKTTDILEFHFSSREICSTLQECSCPFLSRSPILHSECYFTPSGYLSKSHYRFLDIIFSQKFSVKNVMCLGTSTGTEAFGIAKLEECEKLFVNCFFKMNEFSPHVAGNYIPPAFIGQPEAIKIIASSQSAITFNNLLEPECWESISFLTKEMGYRGITCDVEMPLGTINDYSLLLNNLMSFCVANRDTVGWIIIKLPGNCEHNLKSYLSIVGSVFQNVTVEHSLYTKPSLMVFFISASKILDHPPFNRGTEPSIPIQLLSDQTLSRLISIVRSRDKPGMFYLSKQMRDTRRFIDSILPNSFFISCNSYVSGLGSGLSIIPTKERFRTSCEQTIVMLTSSARETIQVAHRAFMQKSMVRSSILQMDTDPLHKALNEIYNKCNRLELLVSCLDKPTFDFDEVTDHCDRWFSRTFSYPLRNRSFTLNINVTRFYNNYSRHLFEILGTLNNHQFSVLNAERPYRLIHSVEGLIPREEKAFEICQLELDSVTEYYTDLDWFWQKRCEVLFCLISSLLIDNTEQKLECFLPHSFVLEDIFFNRNKFFNLVDKDHNSKNISIIWSYGPGVATVERKSLAQEFCIFSKISFLSALSHEYKLIGVYKVPWSGIIPDGLLGHFRQSDVCVPVDIQPAFDNILHTYYPTGVKLIGCGCYDCACEMYLIELFGLSSTELDVACSMRLIESVRDHKHR